MDLAELNHLVETFIAGEQGDVHQFPLQIGWATCIAPGIWRFTAHKPGPTSPGIEQADPPAPLTARPDPRRTE